MKNTATATATATASSSIGLTVPLTIAFIVLKLCNVIDWAWVWVLSPLWISASLVALILLTAIITVAIVSRR